MNINNYKKPVSTSAITIALFAAIISIIAYSITSSVSQDIVNSILSGEIDLSAGDGTLLAQIDRMNNIILTSQFVQLMIFAVIVFPITIVLVKLNLRPTSPGKVFANTLEDLLKSKAFFTYLGFILVSIIIFALLSLGRGFESQVVNTVGQALTTALGTESPLNSFIINFSVKLVMVLYNTIGLFLFTITLFTFTNKYFSKKYKQSLLFKTIIKRAFRLTMIYMFVSIIIYLIAYLPLMMIAWKHMARLYVTISVFTLVAFYITNIPSKFTARDVKIINKVIAKNQARQAQAMQQNVQINNSTISPITSRSRKVTGFTKTQEIKGSRIERPRRKRR